MKIEPITPRPLNVELRVIFDDEGERTHIIRAYEYGTILMVELGTWRNFGWHTGLGNMEGVTTVSEPLGYVRKGRWVHI